MHGRALSYLGFRRSGREERSKVSEKNNDDGTKQVADLTLVVETVPPAVTMSWRNPRNIMMPTTAAPKKELRGITNPVMRKMREKRTCERAGTESAP